MIQAPLRARSGFTQNRQLAAALLPRQTASRDSAGALPHSAPDAYHRARPDKLPRGSKAHMNDAANQAVLVERRGNVMILTLNRPEVHNACNLAMWLGAGEALEQANADPEVRVV